MLRGAHIKPCQLGERSANFFHKGLKSKYFKLVCHTVSIKTAQVCHSILKTATDNMETHEHSYVLIKLALQKQTRFSP